MPRRRSERVPVLVRNTHPPPAVFSPFGGTPAFGFFLPFLSRLWCVHHCAFLQPTRQKKNRLPQIGRKKPNDGVLLGHHAGAAPPSNSSSAGPNTRRDGTSEGADTAPLWHGVPMAPLSSWAYTPVLNRHGNFLPLAGCHSASGSRSACCVVLSRGSFFLFVWSLPGLLKALTVGLRDRRRR